MLMMELQSPPVESPFQPPYSSRPQKPPRTDDAVNVWPLVPLYTGTVNFDRSKVVTPEEVIVQLTKSQDVVNANYGKHGISVRFAGWLLSGVDMNGRSLGSYSYEAKDEARGEYESLIAKLRREPFSVEIKPRICDGKDLIVPN